MIRRVSELVADFPEIAEVDLNPVFATPDGAIAADVRDPARPRRPRERPTYTREEILAVDAPADGARVGRGDRRLQRAGQDRQLGHAQPHRRRLPRARSTR